MNSLWSLFKVRMELFSEAFFSATCDTRNHFKFFYKRASNPGGFQFEKKYITKQEIKMISQPIGSTALRWTIDPGDEFNLSAVPREKSKKITMSHNEFIPVGADEPEWASHSYFWWPLAPPINPRKPRFKAQQDDGGYNLQKMLNPTARCTCCVNEKSRAAFNSSGKPQSSLLL